MLAELSSTRSLCVAIAVLALGCSGDSDSQRGHGAPSPSGPTAGAGGATSPGGAAGAFGNSDTPVQPGGMMQPMQQPMQQPMSGGREPQSIDDCGATNPAGLSADQLQTLMAGSGSAGALRLLNPYDGTVFPRGIQPPTLMWDGDNGTQYVYLHIQSRLFEYKGCLAPTAPGQLLVPEAVWAAAGEHTEGTGDPFRVELTVMGGAAATGPAAQSWTIAQATLKGSIYYNSYSSQLAMAGGLGFGGGSGAVLRIPRGGSAEAFLGSTGCNACHSVSANGERMVSLPLGNLAAAMNAASYVLTPQGAPNPAPLVATIFNGAFAGVSPDGKLYVTSAHQTGGLLAPIIGPRAGGPGAVGGPTAGLFETDTGTEVTGSGIVTGAMMATFAQDGTQLAFTDLAIDSGHGLAVMRFDQAARTASDYRQVYATGDAARYPGWPFFLPDGKALVFAIGAATDFSGNGAGIGMGAAAPTAALAPASDLYIVDLASGVATVLAQAMGSATAQDFAAGTTYLPFGAEELHKHYYPTVAPVAAGGYFWVFFDSMRHYGNQGMQRQIWGAAIDVAADGTYEADRSHPAFYLTGQEANTGNHRAFAALNPCKMDDDTCTSGTDCCGGFCYVPEGDDEFGEAQGTCTHDVPMCSKINERCTSTADCCPPEEGAPAITCIAGYCAVVQTPT